MLDFLSGLLRGGNIFWLRAWGLESGVKIWFIFGADLMHIWGRFGAYLGHI